MLPQVRRKYKFFTSDRKETNAVIIECSVLKSHPVNVNIVASPITTLIFGLTCPNPHGRNMTASAIRANKTNHDILHT